MKFLSAAPQWYGGHSGFYSQLPKHLAFLGERVQTLWPKRNLATKAFGKLIAWKHSFPARDQSLTWVEWKFHSSIERNRGVMHHALNLEANLPLLAYWKQAPRNLIGTIHFPRELWTKGMLNHLKRLSSAIILYQKDLAFFENIIGSGRIRYVPHGVDTDYFIPGLAQDASGNIEVIYTGQFYRNFEMATRVVLRLAAKNPKVIFHFVVPEQYPGQARSMPYFQSIAAHPAVKWHSGISSDELLALYQRCLLMLLPVDASGANNAIVEALACGLPVVTTDVGGIRDYGGGTVFPVVPNNDDDAMVSVLERYITDRNWQRDISLRSRAFAEQNLAWPLVARKYLNACHELAYGGVSFKEST